jgi:hypothetical protein
MHHEKSTRNNSDRDVYEVNMNRKNILIFIVVGLLLGNIITLSSQFWGNHFPRWLSLSLGILVGLAGVRPTLDVSLFSGRATNGNEHLTAPHVFQEKGAGLP